MTKINIVGLSYRVSKNFFHKTNRQVESCSAAIYFIISKVSPLAYVLPKAFFSLLIYCTTDKKQDAFMLPLPTWFVCNIDSYTIFEQTLCIRLQLKDTIQLEKSSRIFDRGHHTIFNCSIWVFRSCVHIVAGHWCILVCNFSNDRNQTDCTCNWEMCQV